MALAPQESKFRIYGQALTTSKNLTGHYIIILKKNTCKKMFHNHFQS